MKKLITFLFLIPFILNAQLTKYHNDWKYIGQLEDSISNVDSLWNSQAIKIQTQALNAYYVKVDLDSLSGNPFGEVSLQGRIVEDQSWTTIETLTWYGSASDTTLIFKTTSSQKYLEYRIHIDASATAQKYSVDDIYFINWFDYQSNVDDITKSQIVIDFEEHEIHEGDHYFVEGATTLGSGDSLEFIVTTPNTTRWTHMVFNITSTAQADFFVIENMTYTGGSVVTPFNNNRNSSNTSTLIIVSAPGTITLTSADTLETHFLGTGSNPSLRAEGIGGRNSELILKQNEIYYFRVNSGAASNRIDYSAEWYEHTNID